MAKRKRVSGLKANKSVASSSNTPLRAPRRKSIQYTLEASDDDDGDYPRRSGSLPGKDCVDSKATKDEEEPQLVPRKPPWLTDPTYVLYMEQKEKEAMEDLRIEEELKEREHKSRLLNARIKDALKTAAIAARFDSRKSRIVRRLGVSTGVETLPAPLWRSVEEGLKDLGIDVHEDDEADSEFAEGEAIKAEAEVEGNKQEDNDFELTKATFNGLLLLLKTELKGLCDARNIKVVSSWSKAQLALALLEWRDERVACSASEGVEAAPCGESVGMGLNTSSSVSTPTNGNHLAEELFSLAERKAAQCSSVSAASAAAITPTSTAPKASPTSIATGTISSEIEEKIAERVSIALQSALAEMRSERNAEKARENRRFSEFASEFETRMGERIRHLDNRHRAQRAQDREREASRRAQRQEADLVLQKSRDEARDRLNADVHCALTILAERLGNVTRDVGVLFSATGVSPAGAASAAVVEDAGEEGTSFAAMGRKRRRIAATAAAEDKRRGVTNIAGKNILERLEGIEMNILECLEKTKDPEAGLNNPPQTPPQGRGNDIATTSSGSGLRWPWVGGKWLGGGN